MTKTLFITLLTLGSQFALADSDVIDPKLVAKVQVQVSEERDAGKVCMEWYRSGQSLVSNFSFERPCSEVPKKKKHVYSEKHMMEKLATPVLTMKDGSELKLETIKFERDINEAELPWGYDAPLEGWQEEAKAILGSGSQVYFKGHCYRLGLRSEIIRDERVGGMLYHDGVGQLFEHCESHPASAIKVLD